MTSPGTETDEYLPDPDDSSDEHERPNRWTGAPGTWLQLNSTEVNTLTALDEIRHQDLSVHLYNTFVLKHRHNKGWIHQGAMRPVPNQDINTTTGQLVQDDKWVPPRSWAAWPLPANAVPHSQFMGRRNNADEPSAFKMQKPYMPKDELEEAVSSTILRFAKEKFQARQMARRSEKEVGLGSQSSDEGDSETNASSVSGGAKLKRGKAAKTRPVKYESLSESELMEIDDSNAGEQHSSVPPESIQLKSVVAADDDLSYTLLRPSAGEIIGKLDTTLTILHKAQESRMNCPTDSDSSDSSHGPFRSLKQRRSSGNPRTPGTKRRRLLGSHAPAVLVPPEEPMEGKRRVGRPRKVYPRLDGETDKDFAIRIARLKKKPIPYFPEDDAEPVSDSTPAPNLAAEHANQNTRKRHDARRGTSEAPSDVTSDGERREKPTRLQRKTRLRDWRDVLGAAALAGFPAPAIDRVARRCADLFGQQFTLHTLQEGSQGQSGLGNYVHHAPGMRITSLPEDWGDGDDSDDEKPLQRLSSRASRASRTSNTSSTTTDESESEAQGPEHPARIPTRGRSRSRRVRTGGAHFCIMNSCPRAIDPFKRRANMIRHLRLVHNYDYDALPVEVDSGDEMHGAVHVDGFLKPIKVRRGWRDENATKERRRPSKGARAGTVETEMEDHEMRNADSTSSSDESD
ncbi:RNA polymerase I-specific transcription initiation factor-domain-containing protein [Xylaria intraflava]|nr:RNA polymerase I-specific transcription initiation factor-domain-containing protein [Xylaria intraflava]